MMAVLVMWRSGCQASQNRSAVANCERGMGGEPDVGSLGNTICQYITGGYLIGCALDSSMVLHPSSVDQREHMVIGCNRILTVAQDFFFRLLDGGILIKLKMNSVVLLFIFRWLIHVSTLADL
jgi:hypothetical protein